MQKIGVSLLMFILFQGSVFGTRVVVSTPLELFNALKSDTEIELAPGTYNLSEVAGLYTFPNIAWENNYDGYEPVLSGLNNLSLFGKKKAKIVIEPRYAWVMNFVSCSNLLFDGLTFGHTEAGSCMGGVLSFTACKHVRLENCHLFGSGTVGIQAQDSENITVNQCDIYECTYGLAYLYTSNNITFTKTKFRNTGNFDLIEIAGCKQVTFNSCMFKGNYNSRYAPHLFSVDANILHGELPLLSTEITIEKCTFNNNQVHKFVNSPQKVKLINNTFKKNLFEKP